jgi:hypothetical protein
MSLYKNTSPYYLTPTINGYLDVLTYRNIVAERDDILFTITKNYEHRPDLLAYDLYGDVNLWWVFAIRNPSVINDPIYNMKSGIQIYLPKITSIKHSLGI